MKVRAEFSSDDVWFYAAKGGQGTTVTACLFALTVAKRHVEGDPYAVIFDTTGTQDVRRAMGMPTGTACSTPTTLTRGLAVHDVTLEYFWDDLTPASAIVVDGGQSPPPEWWTGRIMLVTTPCYMALARAVATDIPDDTEVIMVNEHGRAWTHRDVADVLSRPIACVIDRSSVIARSVDAGLLATRPPRTVIL